jgi:ADP-ribose pyrophosphatase YjhB (NUDIX family)
MKKIITRNWICSNNILDSDSSLEVRQVSCWIVKNSQILVVSKNAEKWSIPGGHTETGETVRESLNREILEETGLDISKLDAQLIGYYIIKESNDSAEEKYLQLRFFVEAKELDLNLTKPIEEHEIKYSKLVNINEIPNFVKWASDSEDFKIIKNFLNT